MLGSEWSCLYTHSDLSVTEVTGSGEFQLVGSSGQSKRRKGLGRRGEVTMMVTGSSPKVLEGESVDQKDGGQIRGRLGTKYTTILLERVRT